MIKYVILELASIASFALLFIFYRQLENQPQIRLVFAILFLILFILILLVIPAMILLSFIDKKAPNVLKTYPRLKPRYFGMLVGAVGFWVFYLIYTIYKNWYSLYLSFIVVSLIFFIVMSKTWKKINIKTFLIFWGLIAVTFIIILFLFQSLLLIPFYF
ncbi:MAG: hypothetical protein Q8P26_04220 [Candidatus Levybacteria bacterium]|nr:hypothetical protein [Candidatus Levybacteria bacterium]